MANNPQTLTLPLLITKGLILFPKVQRLIDAWRDFSINSIKVSKDKADSLVLGCTHYPIIKEYIRNKVGNDVDIIDMGELLASKIELVDSNSHIDLFFSKKAEKTNEYVNKILEIV